VPDLCRDLPRQLTL